MLKMFLKLNDIFEGENVFILLESSWTGVIYIVYLNKWTISPVSCVTYQKVVK